MATEPNRAVAEWMPPEPRRIRITREVPRPHREVEEVLRTAPEHVLKLAYPDADLLGDRTIRLVPYPKMAWLSVPVVVDAVTSGGSEGAIVSVRWHSAWITHAFPVMDAELRLHSAGEDACLLELDGLYHPPLGVIGVLVDTALGRRVADATGCTFLDSLADALRA